jgi:uncharacterized protein
MPMPNALANLSHLSLTEIEALIDEQGSAPVAQWNPPSTGHSRMRITPDGRWYHDGSPIMRESLIRLFSSILRREEDGRYVLVTPVEQQEIDVEDAPFCAVEIKSEGEGEARRLAFRLNTGDLILAGAEHAIAARGTAEAPAHYLHVRAGLEARISRAVYYELANMALDEGHDPPGVWSAGQFFALEPTA